MVAERCAAVCVGQRRTSPLGGGGRQLEELGAVCVPGAAGQGVGLPGVTACGCRSPVPADSASLKDDSEVSLSFKTITLQIKWLTYNPHTVTGTV